MHMAASSDKQNYYCRLAQSRDHIRTTHCQERGRTLRGRGAITPKLHNQALMDGSLLFPLLSECNYRKGNNIRKGKECIITFVWQQWLSQVLSTSFILSLTLSLAIIVFVVNYFIAGPNAGQRWPVQLGFLGQEFHIFTSDGLITYPRCIFPPHAQCS